MEPAHRKELELWAEGLMRSEMAELRAAGRAIRSLCGENEALEQRVARLEGHGDAEPRPEADDDAGASPRRAVGPVPWRRVLIAVAAVAVVGAVVALAARAAVPAATDAEWLLDGKPVTAVHARADPRLRRRRRRRVHSLGRCGHIHAGRLDPTAAIPGLVETTDPPDDAPLPVRLPDAELATR
jgi:hypothetical protein